MKLELPKLNKWNYRFIFLAFIISTFSKDKTKVGSVLVRSDKTIASMGFNGLPPYMNDEEHLKDREKKNQCILHAEENAILSCKDSSLEGFSLYVWGLHPCAHCASIIASKGIKEVYYINTGSSNEFWIKNKEIAMTIFKECGVNCQFVDSWGIWESFSIMIYNIQNVLRTM